MKKILVVEDDLSIQDTISEFLSMEKDYTIITAEDGEIAMDQVMNDPPDLILLDVLLPRINGLAFMKNLQKMNLTKNIPVIFMSGQMIDDVFKKEGLELGAVDYIIKPLDLPYLVQRIRTIFSSKE